MAKKIGVRRGQASLGEFTMEELIEKLGKGIISCYDKIYIPNKDKWITIEEISDISKYITTDYHWKYRREGDLHGPIVKEDLIFFIKEGKISATDWVYHPSFKKWEMVKNVNEFAQFAKQSTKQEDSKGLLEDALDGGFYKTCPNCGLQNIKSATVCKGCKYIFPVQDK